ncbi:hypothetical protein [Phaffia rhodozyma]|uniref:Uncharacterized protein n=1 Tax=Phaffia rhodozyma TaxID=264483 RepID=A0A0F7SGT0_PHARH|nr:hypothetical protein [Phaffia rhodozyma]
MTPTRQSSRRLMPFRDSVELSSLHSLTKALLAFPTLHEEFQTPLTISMIPSRESLDVARPSKEVLFSREVLHVTIKRLYRLQLALSRATSLRTSPAKGG